VFVDRDDAHLAEHSVEVQLPFLQFIMKKKFSIVPIVIGSGGIDLYAEIARELKPYFNSKNLFIISTDFSHYPSYENAKKVDMASANAVCSNNTSTLLDTLKYNESLNIPNLVTSMCGWSCVMTLLGMTEDTPGVSYHEILYRNSGDARIGGRDAVVGYHAIAVSLEPMETAGGFTLSESGKKELLSIVRKTLSSYIEKRQTPEIDASSFSPALLMKCGAFVTLKKHGDLRGCIGRFEASEPLYKVIQSMAIASATEDPRFRPVEMSELPVLEVEISVLTPMRKIRSIDEIEMGKHGIYIKKGWHSGTFLPQVATETGWSKEEFLGHCAQDKAGIGWDGWKDAEIFIYEALVFGENEGVKR
jgi:AmmeMemoRadiSam system protein A